MSYPVERLSSSLGTVISVTHQETVRDALAKMVTNDFSQLPVVDEQGHLTGIISEQSISRTYFHISEQVSLFDLFVDHCLEKPVTLSAEADIFEALERLESANSVVVVDGKKPIGILTYYDATRFFQERTKGLILVEDIEITLRGYIEAVCDTESKMKAALVIAFGIDKRDSSSPAKQYEGMSFWDHVQFISTEKNWPKFQAYLEPKRLFQSLMEQVRDIRNQLMHFRDEVSSIQFDALQRSRAWLVSRPKHQVPETVTVVQSIQPQPSVIEDPSPELQAVTGKYRPLYQWLSDQAVADTNVQITFEQIEQILRDSLPPAARTHQSWWANDSVSHRQSQAWLRAGWRVSDYDLSAETVTFQRTNSVLYQLFFADALDMLKDRRPGITQASKTWAKSTWYFGAGRAGFTFGWTFDAQGRLRTDLYFDSGDAESNKEIYDWFYSRRGDIEQKVGMELLWQPLETHRACRVSVTRPGSITDPPEKLQELRLWAVATMISMVDAFRPLLQELPREQ